MANQKKRKRKNQKKIKINVLAMKIPVWLMLGCRRHRNEYPKSFFKRRGSSVKVFNYGRKERGITGYQGYYEGQHDGKKCKFFKNKHKPISPKFLTSYQTSYKISSKTNHPNLLVPTVVSPTLSLREVVIGYRFDDFFLTWLESNPKQLFRSHNSVMNPWFRRQIKNVLQLIEHMRFNNVYHGALDQPTSYVVVDETLCIINPIGGEVTDENHGTEKDLRDFIGFLLVHMTQGHTSVDWTSFVSLLPKDGLLEKEGPNFDIDTRIKQMRNHPVLKGGEEQITYFRLWWDFCQPFYDDLCTTLDNIEVPTELETWNDKTRIIDPVFLEVLQYPETSNQVAPYTDEIIDLPRYIRNLIKHIQDFSKTRMNDIARDLNKQFPGYLSFFHSACSKDAGNVYHVVAHIDD